MATLKFRPRGETFNIPHMYPTLGHKQRIDPSSGIVICPKAGREGRKALEKHCYETVKHRRNNRSHSHLLL